MPILLLDLPYLSLGHGALLIGIIVSLPRLHGKSPRRNALLCLLAALIFFALALWRVTQNASAALLDPWLPCLEADALDGIPLLLYPVIAALAICVAPRRDVRGYALSGILLLVFGTEIVYASASIFALNVGWWITCLPFVCGAFGQTLDRKLTSLALITSAALLTAASLFFHSASIHDMSSIPLVSLVLLLLAVVVRKGLFPLHQWSLRLFEHGPMIPAALLFNAHLGALLVARSESNLLPPMAHQVLDWLCLLALLTALVTSLRGLFVKRPRRMLAFVCISQASFILAGLSASNTAGVMGGMLHWMVVSFASTGLIVILRILEVRVVDVADPNESLGLAVRAPRLATFFLICGLALVGLPGTMGYCAEDLLFHGAQERHPVMGVALLLATALNAINLLRLYSVLFLGVLPKNVIEIPDALPRERWPLALIVVVLITGGIFPSLPVAMRKAAMEHFHLEAKHHE
jgi:NADH:ubiquinone oxidoreductase subunit 4 (subunit M)